jgi:hypothetical protein
MPLTRMLLVAGSSWLMVLVACGACTEREGEESKGENAPVRSRIAPLPQETPSTASGGGSEVGGSVPRERPASRSEEGALAELVGEVDAENRFLATVVVVTHLPGAVEKGTQCSGVVLAPRLVLTAGHCVCMKRKLHEPGIEGRKVVDGKACVATAAVNTLVYESSRKGEGLRYYSDEHSGQVRLHPEFKVLLDEQDRVLSSHADLAVILLDEQMEERIPAARLAETQLEPNESVVLVDYGYDGKLGGTGGHRRFSTRRVTQAPDAAGGRALFDQGRWEDFSGESGGACLRESDQGFVLVGISSRGLGRPPALTSIYPYRSWLLTEIERAAQSESVVPLDRLNR